MRATLVVSFALLCVAIGIARPAAALGTVTCASPSSTFTRANVREVAFTQIGDMVAIEIRTRAQQGEETEFLALVGSASLCTLENVRIAPRP